MVKNFKAVDDGSIKYNILHEEIMRSIGSLKDLRLCLQKLNKT